MRILTLIVSLASALALGGGVCQPPRGIDIRGTVTDVRPSATPEGEHLATVLVEGKKEADTQYDKASVRITRATRLRLESSNRPVALEDLAVGTVVEMRFTGPVAESYPVQATAEEVAVLRSAAPEEPHAGHDSEEPFAGTAGIVDRPGSATEAALLVDVRTAQHEGFDRTVFEFAGDALPAYHIEYIDKPVRSCGSGEVVPFAGDAWLEVRFTGANAHTESGEPTVKDRTRSPNLTILKDLKLTCDFEAEVEWVLGVASPNKYRVLELKNPTRLVVDIKHNR